MANELDSDIGNGSGESINAGNSGATDSGNSSATGAIDPSVSVAGKRGRHVKDCDCAKCVAKRSAGGGAGSAARSERGSAGSEKRSAKEKGLDLDAFAMQLVGVHKLGAIMLKNDLVAITDEEGRRMAHAIKEVTKHYNIVPDPKTMAWIQLAGVSATVYGPKLMVVMQVQKMRAEARRAAAQSPIPKAPLQPTPQAPVFDPNPGGGVYQFQ